MHACWRRRGRRTWADPTEGAPPPASPGWGRPGGPTWVMRTREGGIPGLRCHYWRLLGAASHVRCRSLAHMRRSGPHWRGRASLQPREKSPFVTPRAHGAAPARASRGMSTTRVRRVGRAVVPSTPRTRDTGYDRDVGGGSAGNGARAVTQALSGPPPARSAHCIHWEVRL